MQLASLALEDQLFSDRCVLWANRCVLWTTSCAVAQSHRCYVQRTARGAQLLRERYLPGTRAAHKT